MMLQSRLAEAEQRAERAEAENRRLDELADSLAELLADAADRAERAEAQRDEAQQIIDKARADCAALREALRFYAARASYQRTYAPDPQDGPAEIPPVTLDGGRTAREALGEEE